MRQVVAEEGAMALTTGLGATAFGYFVQGWFKFGGVEFFKIQAVSAMGEEKAWNNKTQIYLGAAAAAEFIADIFLCPLEAVRIRSVSDPEFCDGLVDGFGKMLKADGIGGFYSGFLPILAKQIPYTMAKFAVQGEAADAIYASMGSSPKDLSSSTNLGISLASGVIAGVAAAVISHPADTLLSKINKKGAGGDGPMVRQCDLLCYPHSIVLFHLTNITRCLFTDDSSCQHCQGSRFRQPLHSRTLASLRHDWNSHCRTIRNLRHSNERFGCFQVPLPRPQ
jgi:solute carrier family 25 phosphate transporter 3